MEEPNDPRTERQRRAAEIIARVKAGAAAVLAKYPVEIAYVYGSVARSCPLPSSDVDIALVLSKSPAAYERLILELDIQAALEDAALYLAWTRGRSITLHSRRRAELSRRVCCSTNATKTAASRSRR